MKALFILPGYGNTGCGVLKRGVYFCLRINIPKGNFWIVRIGLTGSLSSLQKSLILSNFVPPVWELHNPYCHSVQWLPSRGSFCRLSQLFLTTIWEIAQEIPVVAKHRIYQSVAPFLSPKIPPWIGRRRRHATPRPPHSSATEYI